MSAETLPTIGQSIVEDIEAFAFTTAITRLGDPQDGGALSPVLAGLLRARAQIGLEKWRTAYDTLQQVKNHGEVSTLERLEAQVQTARVLRIGWWSTDYALDVALAAAQQATRTNALSLAVDAHLEAAILFGRKRCRDLSRKQLEAADAVGVHRARVSATTADLAISFDERPVAKDAFTAAIERAGAEANARARGEGERLGRLGLAKLHTVLGEFDSAAQELAALGERPHGDIGAHRVAWRLHAAKADWPSVARVLGQIVEASPEGDPSRSLMLERASALYRAGDVDGARAAWTKISATGGGDWAARTAARALDRIGSGRTRRARLQAFPSVTQLRNHCGPASVELCMRFFGTTAEQVAVAREIKHPDGGTPVHRMRRYMDAAGFHTRRIEAGLDRLKAILDAGIPAIIEEDYSTSRHVAVAIGYDDRREILEVQDPMTHEVRETGYDELSKLRDFSNHGALVAVPAGRADLIARLDEAGAVECEYITKTDLAWEAHEQKRDEEAERLLAEAIALHEPYELAWVLKFVRARSRRDQEPNEANDRALAQVLDRILELWPDDEWPQQFLGRVRDVQGRTQDALAAFERARDRDPDDANNWCSIGDCKLALGDRKGARDAFEQALRRDPAHTRSNENLADMAFDDGDTSLATLLNDCALELAPDNAFNWHVRGRVLGRAERLSEAIAAYHRALELRPGAPGFTVERARLLGRAGQVAEAVSSLEALRDQRQGDTWVLMNLADLAYNHDQLDACLAACAAFREADAESATPLAIAGAAKCKRGELEAGLADLKAALQRRPTYAWAHREMAKGLAGAQRWDEAIMTSLASLGVTGSAESQWVVGDVMARAGYGQDGAGYLRRAARSGALTDSQLERVAEVIGDLEGAGPVHSFFGSLGEEHPREVAIARAHSRYLLERIWAPGAAVAVLSRLSEMAPEDPCVIANEADDLMEASIDDEPRGEELFRQAIAAAPKLVTPRRFFARHLNRRGRFAEALEVLEPCPASADTLGDRVHALLGLRRDADAQAAIDAWCDSLPAEVRDARRRPLAYRIAHANRRWDEALELATALAADSGELDDDGKLGRWEDARFECLVALGRSTEAGAFGCTQCGSAREWGQLAYGALAQSDLALARDFATTCHEQDPNESYGLTVLARLADHDGDVPKAIALWQRMKEVSTWHVHDENLGRLALAAGELEKARASIEAAVSTGHTCPVALQLRAELKLRAGDRDGALVDAERARACLQLERRDVSEDLDGLIAGLHGRLEEARGLFERWKARETLSASDVAGHRGVAAALGL